MVYCPRCGGHMCWDKNAKGVGWWGCQDGCWLLVEGPQNATNRELKDLFEQQKREEITHKIDGLDKHLDINEALK